MIRDVHPGSGSQIQGQKSTGSATLVKRTSFFVFRITILFMKSATVMPLASLMLLLKGEGMMGDIPVSLRSDQGEHCGRTTTQLWNIAGESAGLSGRTIRKLPFLALASLDTSGKRDLCLLLYSFPSCY